MNTRIFSSANLERTTLSAMLIACALSAGPIIAAESAKAATPSSDTAFQQLDANHDNRISRDEARKMDGLTEAFSGADANHDGALDQKEFHALLDGTPAK